MPETRQEFIQTPPPQYVSEPWDCPQSIENATFTINVPELPHSPLLGTLNDRRLKALPELPHSLLLGTLNDRRLKALRPLRIDFTKECDRVVAHATELDEFGFGDNLAEARSDLQRAIVELYFSLEHHQDRLGADLQRVWNILKGKIESRP